MAKSINYHADDKDKIGAPKKYLKQRLDALSGEVSIHSNIGFIIRVMAHPVPRALSVSVALAGVSALIVAGVIGILGTAGLLIPAAIAIAGGAALGVGSIFGISTFFAASTKLYKTSVEVEKQFDARLE